MLGLHLLSWAFSPVTASRAALWLPVRTSHCECLLLFEHGLSGRVGSFGAARPGSRATMVVVPEFKLLCHVWDLPGAEIWPCLRHWLEDSWPTELRGSPLSFSAGDMSLTVEIPTTQSPCASRLNLSSRWVDSVVSLEDWPRSRKENQVGHISPLGGLLLPVPSCCPLSRLLSGRGIQFMFPGSLLPAFQLSCSYSKTITRVEQLKGKKISPSDTVHRHCSVAETSGSCSLF